MGFSPRTGNAKASCRVATPEPDPRRCDGMRQARRQVPPSLRDATIRHAYRGFKTRGYLPPSRRDERQVTRSLKKNVGDV